MQNPDTLRDARNALIASLMTHITLPHSPGGMAGRLVRGEFVREVAETLSEVEFVFERFRRALVLAACDAADGEAGVAEHAISAIENIRSNVVDDLVPPLRYTASLLLGEYGPDGADR